jgi:hypothetical protein
MCTLNKKQNIKEGSIMRIKIFKFMLKELFNYFLLKHK